MTLGRRELLRFPHVIEKTLDASVVHTLGQPFAAAFAQRVVLAWLAFDRTVFGKLVQRVRPIMPVDEIEVRIARVIGDRAPVARVLHAVNDGPVAAGGLAEATPVLACSQGSKLAIDERYQFLGEIV